MDPSWLLPVVFVAGVSAGYVASQHDLVERMDSRLEDWTDRGDDMPGWKKPLVMFVLWVRFPSTIWYSLRWVAGWRGSRDADGRVSWHRRDEIRSGRA